VVHQDTDLVLPIHLFVEEGKHSTAPDRNADGHLVLVNTYVRDSWGVRDPMGEGILTVGYFQERWFKPRSKEDVSAPEWNPSSAPHSTTYALAAARNASICGPQEYARLPMPLKKFADYMRFCVAPEIEI